MALDHPARKLKVALWPNLRAIAARKSAQNPEEVSEHSEIPSRFGMEVPSQSLPIAAQSKRDNYFNSARGGND
jgi:hypothetical protein